MLELLKKGLHENREEGERNEATTTERERKTGDG